MEPQPWCTRALAVTVVAALVILGRPAPVRAQPMPALTGTVNDLAHVLDADSARDLDTRIRALRTATGDALVVVTVPTIKPFGSIEEYAVKLFEKAGIGKKATDNGLLILVAVQDRRVRIEVGYGLESIVTDGYSGETIRDAMVPEFRAGRFGAGVVAGTARIIQHIAAARGVTLEGSHAPAAGSSGSLVPGLILFVVLCLIVLGVILGIIALIARASGGARTTPVSGGPLGSGSGDSRRSESRSESSSSESTDEGFGGGSSGGGGASGSW